MPFNGSGVFNRIYNWTNDAAANIKIRADRMDAEDNGFATGLSTCITKDGQTTITANLPMANFKHTVVGDATLRNQYFAAGQAVDGVISWAVAGGTADAITASYTIPINTLVDGQLCYVRAGAANATTTPTFSPDGITARTITKNGGQALVAGDIYGAGHELVLRYRLSATRWELMNPVGSILSSNNTFSGTNIFTGNVEVTDILADTSGGGTLKSSGGNTCASWGSGGTANFTLPGLTMTNTVSSILDEDNMASNSATALATQQSIKAYTDNSIAAINFGAGVAALAAGAVGTYMCAVKNSSSGITDFGDTVAGSTLDPCSLNADISTTNPAGTWRCMGYAGNGTATTPRASIWLRTV